MSAAAASIVKGVADSEMISMSGMDMEEQRHSLIMKASEAGQGCALRCLLTVSVTEKKKERRKEESH